ncbi:hypothetical protein Syn7502_03553 [Synechococcus sp. PCC 7502]|uniref:hypothetical protein n=1 Tax=Synechococcus sp. PCC 7502 TaxID=1173263 RepID=UPI00029F8730|nr:hypothetical protein [Synechococcus sp. PCC 7502]AFY75390.1 hypothetical protein Syn7502_03553 [Synechococcus sp. PCC 7502]
MPTWEFLLQKKGDKSWLPLESPTLEILEGEYRLAARCGLVNTPIDIDIDYLSYKENDEQVDQSWQRHFTRLVNRQGLVLIMPFLTFGVGFWQIKCHFRQFNESIVKSLKIEVLEAISSDIDLDWEGFDTESNVIQIKSQDTSATPDQEDVLIDPLLVLELAELDLLMAAPIQNFGKTQLPNQLINLAETEFAVKGTATIEIRGEAYLSGSLEIVLKHKHTYICRQQFLHNTSDSDFFSYTIEIPELSEPQMLTGEVRIYTHQATHEGIDGQKYLTSQAIRVSYQPLVDPFRQFPLLPFENLPAHAPRRNIKFPELPEFLTLGRKNKAKAILGKPNSPLPNWDVTSAFKIPSYADSNDLRFEFE